MKAPSLNWIWANKANKLTLDTNEKQQTYCNEPGYTGGRRSLVQGWLVNKWDNLKPTNPVTVRNGTTGRQLEQLIATKPGDWYN